MARLSALFHGLGSHIFHSRRRNVLKLLGERSPPLHGVDGRAFCGILWGLSCLGLWLKIWLEVWHFGGEGFGHFSHVDIHALQGRQGHFLNFQSLNGGLERIGVLLQPKLNRFEFLNALVEFFNVQGGRHPTGHVGHALWRAFGAGVGGLSQVLQEVKTRHKFSKSES